MSSIAAPVFTYLERFLIGSFLSVGAFAFYAAPYEIISRVVIIPVSLSTTLFPTFSYFDISNCKGIKELLSRPFKYLLFIMVPILIIFIVLANGILKLWLGDEFAQNSTIVFQVLAATFFFHTFAYLPFTAVHGLGRPDLKAKFDLIMLPTFVGLCWWFILKLGLVGAALAKLLITVMDVLYLSWKAKCLLKLPIREMFGERAGKAVIIASLFTIAVFSLRMPFKSILADIAILGGLIPAYMFLFVTTAMDDKDRSALRRIKAIFEDRKA